MFTTTNTNFQSLNKSVGYCKNRTHTFNQYKNVIEEKKHRFQKRDVSPAFLTNNSPQPLLSSRTADTVIELHGQSQLPPQWVDLYDETVEKLKQIELIQKDLQKVIAKRVKVQFGDHSSMDNEIKQKTTEATLILRECEANLNQISRVGISAENESDRRIRKNIQKSLATQISEHTLQLRKQQKNLYEKIKALNAGDDVTHAGEQKHEYLDDDMIQEMEVMDEIAQERDEAINDLIDTINELSHIFKQLNELVIDQGTLLDRIDYNIEQTVENTKKAKKSLIKANTSQQSGCAKKCIMILVLLNVIMAFAFFIRYHQTRSSVPSYTPPTYIPSPTPTPTPTSSTTQTPSTTQTNSDSAYTPDSDTLANNLS